VQPTFEFHDNIFVSLSCTGHHHWAFIEAEMTREDTKSRAAGPYDLLFVVFLNSIPE